MGREPTMQGSEQQRERMVHELQKLPGVESVGQFTSGAMGDRVTLYLSELPTMFDPSAQLDVNAAVWVASIVDDPSYHMAVNVEVHRYPED